MKLYVTKKAIKLSVDECQNVSTPPCRNNMKHKQTAKVSAKRKLKPCLSLDASNKYSASSENFEFLLSSVYNFQQNKSTKTPSKCAAFYSKK
jgi:hypothetical protein